MKKSWISQFDHHLLSPLHRPLAHLRRSFKPFVHPFTSAYAFMLPSTALVVFLHLIAMLSHCTCTSPFSASWSHFLIFPRGMSYSQLMLLCMGLTDQRIALCFGAKKKAMVVWACLGVKPGCKGLHTVTPYNPPCPSTPQPRHYFLIINHLINGQHRFYRITISLK